MTNEQIKYMVDRFLQWKLPENFNPDGGISFKRMFNEKTPWPMKNEPVGTNLLDATQAEEMVRYLVEGLPTPACSQPQRDAELLRVVDDPEIIFYGPHPCEHCGARICMVSREEGGIAFDYPEGIIYLNTNWVRHVCVPAPATPAPLDNALLAADKATIARLTAELAEAKANLLAIKNIATNAWLDPPTVEWAFREIRKLAEQALGKQ